MRKRKDITGQRFGKVVAISPATQNPDGRWNWLCQCDCGIQFVTRSASLLSGGTKSCGCTRKAKRPFRVKTKENKPFRNSFKEYIEQKYREVSKSES